MEGGKECVRACMCVFSVRAFVIPIVYNFILFVIAWHTIFFPFSYLNTNIQQNNIFVVVQLVFSNRIKDFPFTFIFYQRRLNL